MYECFEMNFKIQKLTKVKFELWNLVNNGIFDGLTQNGNPIGKTYNGDKEDLLKDALAPPSNKMVSANEDSKNQ